MVFLVVSHLRKAWLDDCYLNQYFSNYCNLIIGKRKELANKVLLEHNHTHFFFFFKYCPYPLLAATEGSSNCDRDCIFPKTKYLLSGSFQKTFVQSSLRVLAVRFVVISACGKRKVHDDWRWGLVGTICCGWKNECLYLALFVRILASWELISKSSILVDWFLKPLRILSLSQKIVMTFPGAKIF